MARKHNGKESSKKSKQVISSPTNQIYKNPFLKSTQIDQELSNLSDDVIIKKENVRIIITEHDNLNDLV